MANMRGYLIIAYQCPNLSCFAWERMKQYVLCWLYIMSLTCWYLNMNQGKPQQGTILVGIDQSSLDMTVFLLLLSGTNSCYPQ